MSRDRIPQELRDLPQWVVASDDKVPMDAKTGGHASVSDRSTWCPYEQAEKALNGHFKYLGFVFTDGDPYTGIDLDDKEDKPATPEQKERHAKIIEASDSYTERSRSGRGYHVIVRGRAPASVKRDNVEVYSAGHYFILTGDVVRDAPIADRQDLLERLHGEMTPATTVEHLAPTLPTASDPDVLAKVRAGYGDRFDDLSRGNWNDYHSSQSEADLELGIQLARFTSDDEQWLRLFMQTGLGATLDRKGTLKHQRQYLEWTYDEARRRADEENFHIEFGRRVAETLLAHWNASLRCKVSRLLIPWEDFKPKGSLLNLVKGVLGEGGMSVAYGSPGSGKSFAMLDISAAVATGEPWMGHAVKKKGTVIFAAGEGESGLRQRRTAILKARGLDKPPILFLPVALDTPDEVETFLLVLDEATRKYGETPALLIIDTLNRFFGDGDENTAKDMRRFINAVDQLRRAYPALHVMIVHHAGKDPTKGMRGSSALKGAADTVLFFDKQKTKDGETRFIVCVEKQKDGEEGLIFPFRLRKIEVGRDEEGNAITSCVVEPDREVGATGPTLTEPQGVAVGVLRELARTDTLMNSEVDYKAYRDRFCQVRGGNDQSVRKAAQRAVKDLQDRFGAVEWAGGEAPVHVLERIWSLPAAM